MNLAAIGMFGFDDGEVELPIYFESSLDNPAFEFEYDKDLNPAFLIRARGFIGYKLTYPDDAVADFHIEKDYVGQYNSPISLDSKAPSGTYQLELIPDRTGELNYTHRVALNDYVSLTTYPNLTKVLRFGNGLPSDTTFTFIGGINLVSVPSDFDNNFTSFKNMFYGCSRLNDNNLASWNVTEVTDAFDMFANCSEMEVDISSWFFHHIYDHPNSYGSPRFSEGSKLTEEKLPNWGKVPVYPPTPEPLSTNPLFELNVNSAQTGNYAFLDYSHFKGFTLTDPDGLRYQYDTALTSKANIKFDKPGIWLVELLELNEQERNENPDLKWQIKLNYKLYGENHNSSPERWLKKIHRWGSYSKPNSEMSFMDAAYLESVPDYLPPGLTNISRLFDNCRRLNDPNISLWDTSDVTDMSYMFNTALEFNQPLNDWDVSNVTNMSNMFNCYGNVLATNGLRGKFNQPLGNWDVSNVTNMDYMFYCQPYFNQDLSSWCVQNIPEKPAKFDISSTTYIGGSNFDDVHWSNQDYLPVWGTCPIP